MADLSVTIGLDQTELEKGLAGAGKKLGGLAGAVQAGQNPFNAAAGQLSSGMGIGSLLGGPIGGIIGAFFDAFGSMLSAALSKVKEILDYANMIRMTSLKTGLDINQVMELEALGKSFGISLQSMSSAVTEFTRRMGEARIKGGEVTNILAKMGVGMDEIADGSFDATKAMKALADAYAAGTDEATLLYYGTKMFGDAFKDLLPMIKAGSKAIEDARDLYIKGNEESTSAAGRLAQDLSNVASSLWNAVVSIVGAFGWMIEQLQYYYKTIYSLGFFNPFESFEDEVKRKLENTPKYMTNEERIKFVQDKMSDEDPEKVRKEIEKQLRGSGKKLSPFGMAEAGAASQMQQMAGGDIFGAFSFTPLERIATATEETAQNTKPKDAPAPRAPDELSR